MQSDTKRSMASSADTVAISSWRRCMRTTGASLHSASICWSADRHRCRRCRRRCRRRQRRGCCRGGAADRPAPESRPTPSRPACLCRASSGRAGGSHFQGYRSRSRPWPCSCGRAAASRSAAPSDRAAASIPNQVVNHRKHLAEYLHSCHMPRCAWSLASPGPAGSSVWGGMRTDCRHRPSCSARA